MDYEALHRWAVANGISDTKAGQVLAKDSRLLHDVKNGRSLTGRTIDKIKRKAKDYERKHSST